MYKYSSNLLMRDKAKNDRDSRTMNEMYEKSKLKNSV